MLRNVLHLAAARGAIHSNELARMLGTSPELVGLALAELGRSDYLTAMVPGGSSLCEHCPLRAACLNGRQARVWTLTRKGRAWIAAASDAPSSAAPSETA